MLALTVEQARTVGLGAIGVLIIGGLVAMWLVRKVVQKVLLVVVLVGLAAVVWSQRESVEDCADRVQADGNAATCTFFGRDVTID